MSATCAVSLFQWFSMLSYYYSKQIAELHFIFTFKHKLNSKNSYAYLYVWDVKTFYVFRLLFITCSLKFMEWGITDSVAVRLANLVCLTWHFLYEASILKIVDKQTTFSYITYETEQKTSADFRLRALLLTTRRNETRFFLRYDFYVAVCFWYL